MASDYSKDYYHKQRDPRRRRDSSRSRSRSSSPLMWMIIGICFGFGSALLFYFFHEELLTLFSYKTKAIFTAPKNATNQKQDQAKENSVDNKASMTQENNTQKKPRFDFYTILPKDAVASVDNTTEVDPSDTIMPASTGDKDVINKKLPQPIDAESMQEVEAAHLGMRTSASKTADKIKNGKNKNIAENNEQINVANEDEEMNTLSKPLAKAKETAKKITEKNENKQEEKHVATRWIVELNTFEKHGKADSARAQYLLSGVEVKSRIINDPQHGTLYQLYLGPFNNKQTAQAILKDVINKGIHAQIVDD